LLAGPFFIFTATRRIHSICLGLGLLLAAGADPSGAVAGVRLIDGLVAPGVKDKNANLPTDASVGSYGVSYGC